MPLLVCKTQQFLKLQKYGRMKQFNLEDTLVYAIDRFFELEGDDEMDFWEQLESERLKKRQLEIREQEQQEQLEQLLDGHEQQQQQEQLLDGHDHGSPTNNGTDVQNTIHKREESE